MYVLSYVQRIELIFRRTFTYVHPTTQQFHYDHLFATFSICISMHRAEKFARNNDEHVQETARLLAVEDTLTTACFSNILEETIEYEERNSELSMYRYDNAEKKILQVKNDLEIESNFRITADSVLLDTIIKSQRMLQQTIEQIDLNVQET